MKNVPGRPKTDRLDAVWLAKLTERGMLRPSFVPPKPVRQLRDLIRSRAVLTHERTRHKQRAEKLLEDTQIKLSTVIPDIFGASGRAMLEALIAGESSPRALADLAHGTIRASHETLTEALRGQFEEHHAFMLRTLLDTIDYLTVQIDKITARITVKFTDLTLLATENNDPDGPDDDGPGQGLLMPLTDVERLDEIPGVGTSTAQVILAETGLDMSVFPTAGHLVSWAKLSPPHPPVRQQEHLRPHRQRQPLAARSPRRSRDPGRPHRYLLRRPLPTHRQTSRPYESPGRRRAPILVSVWHLMSNPNARYRELGSDFHTRNLDPNRKTRDVVRQLKALGHDVTLAPAAA